MGCKNLNLYSGKTSVIRNVGLLQNPV